LITIVAPGGMGKTRLAIAAAENQLAQANDGNDILFSDGIFFVPMASLSAPDQIAPAIASTLNLPVDGGPGLARSTQAPQSPLDRLTAYLCEKQILLVLDNFEHLLAGVELLPELLQAAPSLNILVTTRERLHLQEEQVFPLVGLRFPDWEAPEEPHDYTAMQLFLQSARRVRPDFDLAPGDMTHLTRICNLVGGMPLALELAAAWADVLSPAEIAAEIQGSLDFLESDLRNLPERHRSMRAVCNAAWERLTAKEQDVFQRLSVFWGGFSRMAAQTVCEATFADLARLVDKAIIKYESSTERYQIHELLRQYSSEKLAKHAETEKATRDGHSTYFCCKARELGDELLSGKHREALHGFDVDLVNFQNGWDWAIEQGCYENLNNAIIGLVGYYDWILQVQKSREICQSAVNMLESQGMVNELQAESSADMALPLRLYALAIGTRGYCNFFFNPSQSKEDIAHSLHILDHLLAQNHDARYEKASMLWFLGLFEFQYGEQEAAYGILLESLALSREIECSWLIEYVLIWVGAAAALRGNQQDARKWWQQLLIEACNLDDPAGQLWAYDCLGGLAWDLNEYEQSEALFEQGWRVARQHNDHPEGINVLTSLSNLMLFLGKLEQALAKCDEAVDFATKTNQFPRVVNCLTNKAVAQWLSGDLVQAGITIEEALFFGKQHTSNLNVYAITGRAEWLALTGDYPRAEVCVQILKSIPEELLHERYMPGPYLSGRFQQTLGWIELGQQQYARAEFHFERSIEIFQNISKTETTAWSQAGLAWAEIKLGNWKRARQLLQEALTTTIEIQGYIPMVFILPVALLILSREDPALAAPVYQQVRSDPFMSKAQLFHDLVYQYLPDEITALTFEVVEQSPKHRKNLWATARSVLGKWRQEQAE
ncbi:MAG: tetratricopeptide repeat protein, partial [Anaerolineales bacterium]